MPASQRSPSFRTPKKGPSKKAPSKKGSAKKGAPRSIKRSSSSKKASKNVWVISPETGRFLKKDSRTYAALKTRGLIKDIGEYVMPPARALWRDIKPQKGERDEMFAKYPHMFLLPPKWALPEKDQDLNQDDEPKYPIASAAHPSKVDCNGLRAANNRAHLDRRNRGNDPVAKRRFKFIMKGLHAALDAYCT